MRKSEEKYRLLIENSNEAIFIIMAGKIKYANLHTEQMIGYGMEELSSISFINLVVSEDRDMVLELLESCLQGENPSINYSFRITNKQGITLWVEINTKKEIKIHRNFQTDLWPVDVDHGQIEQVLLNLYVNTWQAMPGGGNLYLETKNVFVEESRFKPYVTMNGHYVKISVTDTGVGMDEKTKERIFEPFFTTKEMGRGTGLGLASVYGIIKNHNGFINVYSEKGQGTTFNIYLPASPKKDTRDKDKDVDGDNVISKDAETILLVDDESMILTVGCELLKTLGYTILTAQDGSSAIDLYKNSEENIDLVVVGQFEIKTKIDKKIRKCHDFLIIDAGKIKCLLGVLGIGLPILFYLFPQLSLQLFKGARI